MIHELVYLSYISQCRMIKLPKDINHSPSGIRASLRAGKLAVRVPRDVPVNVAVGD